MFGDGFFVAGSDEYIPNNIISYHYDIFHYTTLHPSFDYFDYFYIFEFMEFDEFLNRFDEFCIDRYCFFVISIMLVIPRFLGLRICSSVLSQKSQKCINMFDRRDIDSE